MSLSYEFIITRTAPGGDFNGATVLRESAVSAVSRLAPNRFQIVVNAAIGVIYPNDLLALASGQQSTQDWLLERAWLYDDAGPMTAAEVGLVTSMVDTLAPAAPLVVAPMPPPLPSATADFFAFGGTGRVNDTDTDPQPGGAVVVPNGYGISLSSTGAGANVRASLTLIPLSDANVLGSSIARAAGLTYQTTVP